MGNYAQSGIPITAFIGDDVGKQDVLVEQKKREDPGIGSPGRELWQTLPVIHSPIATPQTAELNPSA